MNTYTIIADESVDFRIVESLQSENYLIYAVAESSPSLSDADILKLAVENNALLITEDKDFGELVYRFKMDHCGILLIRLVGYSSDEKASLVKLTIEKHFDQLKNVFSVLDERKIRIRK